MDEKKVLYVVDKIADKLAVPSKEIINAYAASGVQNVVSAIGSFILFSLCMYGLLYTIKHFRNTDESERMYDVTCMLMFTSFTLPIIAAFAFYDMWGSINRSVLWLSDPRAYAIVTLMQKLLK